jgi:hypothetical protein
VVGALAQLSNCTTDPANDPSDIPQPAHTNPTVSRCWNCGTVINLRGFKPAIRKT